MEILVLGLLLIFFLLVRISLNVENPGPIQQLAVLHGFVSGQADSIIGPGAQRYIMFTTSVLMFVLLVQPARHGSYWPDRATSVVTVPLGVALVLALRYYGLRKQGVLSSPERLSWDRSWWISWMMLPIELIF